MFFTYCVIPGEITAWEFHINPELAPAQITAQVWRHVTTVTKRRVYRLVGLTTLKNLTGGMNKVVISTIVYNYKSKTSAISCFFRLERLYVKSDHSEQAKFASAIISRIRKLVSHFLHSINWVHSYAIHHCGRYWVFDDFDSCCEIKTRRKISWIGKHLPLLTIRQWLGSVYCKLIFNTLYI